MVFISFSEIWAFPHTKKFFTTERHAIGQRSVKRV